MQSRRYFLIYCLFGCFFGAAFVACKNEKQNTAQEIFHRYEGSSGVQSFQIPPNLMSLFMSPSVGKELDLLVKDIQNIKVISIQQETFKRVNGLCFKDVFRKSLQENSFSEALVFSQNTDIMNVLFLQKEKIVQEIVISLENSELFFAVRMEGEIPIEKFVRFSQQVNPLELLQEVKQSSQTKL